MTERPEWLAGLTPGDWLFNGEPIRSKARLLQWSRLDWSRAYVDAGPSPAGNPGPYWHVPWKFQGEELWARLYPKIMQTKWAPLIRRAMTEMQAKATTNPHGKEKRVWK